MGASGLTSVVVAQCYGVRRDVHLRLERLEVDDASLSRETNAQLVPAKRALEAIAKEFDYTYINAHPAFAGRNTSAENLARYFAERLEASGALGWTRVAEVTIWEGPENRATYTAPR